MSRPDKDDPLFDEVWKYESLQHNHPWKWIEHKEKSWAKEKWRHLKADEWVDEQKKELADKWLKLQSKHPASADFLIRRGMRMRQDMAHGGRKDHHGSSGEGKHDGTIVDYVLHDFEKIMIDTGVWLVVDQMTKGNVLDLNFWDYVTFIFGDYVARNMYDWPIINHLEIPSIFWWHAILNRAFIIELVRLGFVLVSKDPSITAVKIIHDLSKLTMSLGISNIFTL